MPTLRKFLSRSDILSTASSVIASYPSITSAYLFGSYAKGTAHPDSDVDIAIFHPDLSWNIRREIGGVHMGLEDALNKQVDIVDISVCPSDASALAFVEKIKMYWVPINLGTPLLSSSTDATHPPPVAPPTMPSDEKKERLQHMEKTCKDLIKYINDVNSMGGVSMINALSKHAISFCVNRLGQSIKNRDLEFDAEVREKWNDLRDTFFSHQLDLSSIWDALSAMAQSLFATIELKLAGCPDS